MSIEVKGKPARSRFEATVEGKTAFIEYKLLPGVVAERACVPPAG